MWQSGHESYLESRALSADPLGLVCMLYQEGTRSVREARRFLAAGDIAGRCRAISHAHEVLTALAGSLDHQRGGDLSRRLAQLYDYMQRQLLEANFHQSDAPLADVLGLLSTLSEAWEGISEAREPVPPVSPWAQAPPVESAVHAWSL